MPNNIIIVIDGGNVQEVKGLPPGWNFVIRDYDLMAVGECEMCQYCREPVAREEECVAKFSEFGDMYHAECWEKLAV